jgi:ribosome-associated toxin RatA of RatAB toxin-antitoxin module
MLCDFARPASRKFAMQRMLLVLLFSLIATAPALAARSRVTVDVRRAGETFSINATLFAPVPLDLAWEVLTDFEHMEQFVPNVSDSRIIARQGQRLTIAQRGVARFGPLRFPFESERVVELSPRSEIVSSQIKGNMRRLESVTRFATTEGGTQLSYRVDVEPGAWFPAALTERFLVHEIEEQFEAIVEEMIRRQRS